MKILQLYMALPQLTMLKKLSKKLGLSVAEIVRRAVDEFLKRQE